MKMLVQSAEGENTITDDLISIDGPKRIGLTMLVAVFGIFGAWAAIAPLDGAAFAPGKVTVKSYVKIVQHLEGGIVSDILVEDGEYVEAGQPLLLMDDTQSLAQLEIAESQRIALSALEARLIAERDGLNEISFPSTLQIIDNQVQSEKSGQNAIFNARRTSNEGRTEILSQRVEQLSNQILGLSAQLKAKQLLTKSFEEEMRDTQSLLEKGFSDKSLMRQAERNFASFSGEAAELAAQIAATEIRISETRLEILQISSDFRNEVVSELGEVQTSLQDATEREIALKDVVNRTVVRAPDSGIINGMKIHTVGGVINGGAPIGEIVPSSDDLIIEASVSTTDIDRVKEGQDARIRFASFGSSAPTVFGRVLTISADAITDESVGATYYLARVEVIPDSMESLNGLALVPGMPAEVYINTGSRTLIQYLFKPLSNAVARSFNED